MVPVLYFLWKQWIKNVSLVFIIIKLSKWMTINVAAGIQINRKWSYGRISEDRKSSFSEEHNFLQLLWEDQKSSFSEDRSPLFQEIETFCNFDQKSSFSEDRKIWSSRSGDRKSFFHHVHKIENRLIFWSKLQKVANDEKEDFKSKLLNIASIFWFDLLKFELPTPTQINTYFEWTGIGHS